MNDVPLAKGENYVVAEDTRLVIDVERGLLANDFDPDNSPLVLQLVEGPSSGTLVADPDGSFDYEPDADFNGTDSFSYRVGDGEATSEIAIAAIRVTPIDDLPIASDDVYSVGVDSTLVVDESAGVLANDVDVDGDRLQARLTVLPEHGTVALNADGSFLFRPQTGFVGVNQFSYQATDGELNSDFAIVSVTVGRVGDLTGDRFVDFQDLTILLANWNQMVSAGLGNLVDPGSTPINFHDLTLLLAVWTGPGPAASPQAAVAEATFSHMTSVSTHDTATNESRAPTNADFDRLGRRDHASFRRADRASGLSPLDSPLRRLHAVAVDRAMGEEEMFQRGRSVFARRARRRA